MAVCEAREVSVYVRCSKVRLPEIYSPMSEAFCPAYAGKSRTPGIEVAPTSLSGVDLGGWVAVLPVLSNLGS